MATFRMPVPPAPDEKLTAISIEAEKSRSEFDEYLSYVILTRVKPMNSFAREKQNAVLLECKAEIARLVDGRLIECICSTDPIFNHNIRVKKIAYLKEELSSLE